MHDYYKPKHFEPCEFVPPSVMKQLKDDALIVMDYRILKTMDAISDFFGHKPKINDWYWGGNHDLRGYRPAWQFVNKARYNQHNFGRAVDFTIDAIGSENIRYGILKNQMHFPYVTAMQSDTPWVHIDCRAIVSGGIYVFNPENKIEEDETK
jgi:hypothetical protein